MNAQTYTVLSSYETGPSHDRRYWVLVRGVAQSLEADRLYPVGTAVRVANGRAFR